jgi:hypothetical protein
MSKHLSDLHPTPNAEVLADKEIQPVHYEVISTAAHFPRTVAADTEHAQAHASIAFGRGLAREEVEQVLNELVAEVRTWFTDHGAVHLAYVPGTGDGSTPPDKALDEYTTLPPTPAVHPWRCDDCHCLNGPDTETCDGCGSWHDERSNTDE